MSRSRNAARGEPGTTVVGRRSLHRLSASPRLAILGAGPTGLDAALAAAERGWDFRIYEAASRPAGALRSWGHVRLFSPWSINASPRMREAISGLPENGDCPTGHELLERVLDPVAALPAIAPRLVTSTRVVAVGREGLLKHESIGGAERAGRSFRLLVRDADGGERIDHADAVLDCTGSYTHPTPLGDGGILAPGESGAAGRIERRLPDLAADGEGWAGRRILLVGGGHSAQTAARDLARLAAERGARVVWALRRERPGWRVADDPLPARDALAAAAEALIARPPSGFQTRLGVVVERLAGGSGDGGLQVTLRPVIGEGGAGAEETLEVDRVLALTGAVGDHALYRQLQIHECYATSGPMKLAAALLGEGSSDCMAQTSHGPDTLRNPEPRFFILGAKSYGTNGAYLMRVGWQQVDDVFSILE